MRRRRKSFKKNVRKYGRSKRKSKNTRYNGYRAARGGIRL